MVNEAYAAAGVLGRLHGGRVATWRILTEWAAAGFMCGLTYVVRAGCEQHFIEIKFEVYVRAHIVD